ncbi:hypothetical protein [Bacillus sp. FJAT-52991]|uniref:Uncharacterized protein n=1 Tax=Bacillus kandeliae TaxID=3129297 RepID=A0ABZ2N518_9BACI
MKENKVWTVTSGKVKSMNEACETVRVLGTVTFQQDVEVKHLSIFGQGSFRGSVVVEQLTNKGVCMMKEACEVNDVKNLGHLQLKIGKMTNVESSGYLKVDKRLDCQWMNVKGAFSGEEIHAKQVHCRLSGASRVHKLTADKVVVERAKGTFSLIKKKLTCETIIGKQLSLSLTEANEVEGEEVVIGPGCQIHTLRYTKRYAIDPSSTVQHIIQMEGTSE